MLFALPEIFIFVEIYGCKPHLLATIEVEMLTITYFVFASVLEPFWGEKNIFTSDGLGEREELF